LAIALILLFCQQFAFIEVKFLLGTLGIIFFARTFFLLFWERVLEASVKCDVTARPAVRRSGAAWLVQDQIQRLIDIIFTSTAPAFFAGGFIVFSSSRLMN